MEAASTSWMHSRLVHWRAGLLTAAVVVCGLVLDLTVLGANPKVDVSTSAAAPVVEVLGAGDDFDEVAAAVPTSIDLALPPVTDGAPAPQTSIDTVPTAPVFAAAQAPSSGTAGTAATPQAPQSAQPPAAQPATAQPATTQPATTQQTVPRAVAPSVSATTAPPTTAPQTTAAPTTAPPTTAAPTTAATTTTVAAAIEYLSYTVNGDVGSVTLARQGNTISLYGFYPNAGWVYEVDRNGPSTVKLGFFNVQTEQDREWKAQIEGGRIQVEN